MASLVTVSVHANIMSKLNKENEPPSDSAVGMGQSSVIYHYGGGGGGGGGRGGNWYCLTYLITCQRGGISFTA